MSKLHPLPFALLAAVTLAAGGAASLAAPASSKPTRTTKQAPTTPAAPANNPGETKVALPDFPAHNKERISAKNVQGQKAPELNVQDWVTTPAATDGKVVIVDFWATWCGPCVAAMPHMSKIADDFKEHVAVIGLSDESKSTIEKFVRDDTKPKMSYAVGTDPQRRLSGWAGVRGIPHILVMSPDGVVRWQGHPAGLNHQLVQQIVQASGLGTEKSAAADPSDNEARKPAPEPIKRRG